MCENQLKAARSRLIVHYQPITHKVTAATVLVLLGALSLCLLATRAQAQAPELLWTTNIGARLFAVDAQTNAYASVDGTVIKLNSGGVPFQTNSICPRPGLAARDTDGNFYFAGVLPSHLIAPFFTHREFDPQDFGGVILSSLAVYVAKYSSNGTLLWATNFGPSTVRSVAVTDLHLDGNGNVFVGYTHNVTTSSHSSVLARISIIGTLMWLVEPPKDGGIATIGSIRVGGTSQTNGFVLTYVSYMISSWKVILSQFDINGAPTSLAGWTESGSSANRAARPIRNTFAEVYTVEQGQLTKRTAAGALMWQKNSAGLIQWTVGHDQWDGVHVGNDSGELSRYSYDGDRAWVMTLPSPTEVMVLDSQGNRFVSFLNGTVARIGAEFLVAPVITNAPQTQTVLLGSNAVFTVGAYGTTPLRYYWRLYGTNVLNATNSTLTLTNVATSQAGNYQVVISNHVGSVTSSPALLRVKNVAIFVGNQLLTNGTYVFSNPPTINIRSAFVNGSAFYTLDGSTPSVASTPYSAPFTSSNNATIRALGYSSDFSQSEEADTVNLVVLPRHTLSISTSGGGSVGSYPPNCVAPPSGLVASWRAEGNALDSIGTNHGTLLGVVSYDQGKVGQAFAINGQGGIMIPPSPTLDVGAAYGFTVELWFSWNGSVGGPLVNWNAATGWSSYSVGYAGMLVYNNGNLAAGFTLGNSPIIFESATGVVSSNQLHHAAFTYDKPSGTGVLYLDGQIVAQSNLGSFTPRTTDAVYLGKYPYPAYYPGSLLDEISVYRRVLSQVEVQAIYQAGSSGKCVPISVGGSYLATETITPTAVPSPGYSFLYWLGDASGPYPSINVSMERDKAIHAVFGTTLSTTVTGNGHVQLYPPGGLYANGSVVRLTGVPQPGNYFGLWGNAASGNINPLYFTISSPTQSVSALFAPTPAGQAALTMLVNGPGSVSVNPPGNVFPTNQAVSVTATPFAGQGFINWSGDASGTQNPLTVGMTQSRIITANFTNWPVLVANPQSFTAQGFRFSLLSGPGLTYQVQGSSNLYSWVNLGVVTNATGETQFTDPAGTNLPLRFYRATSWP